MLIRFNVWLDVSKHGVFPCGFHPRWVWLHLLGLGASFRLQTPKIWSLKEYYLMVLSNNGWWVSMEFLDAYGSFIDWYLWSISELFWNLFIGLTNFSGCLLMFIPKSQKTTWIHADILGHDLPQNIWICCYHKVACWLFLMSKISQKNNKERLIEINVWWNVGIWRCPTAKASILIGFSIVHYKHL